MELLKEVNETSEETKQCSIQLVKSKHVKYLTRMLKVLPEALATMETTRMTLVYFTISALDVLGELDQVISQKEKSSMIDWIYRLQVKRLYIDSETDPQEQCCNGFRGSTFACVNKESDERSAIDIMDSGHLAMTYTALATLIILGDDLSRVDRKSISKGLKKMQNLDGSFTASFEASENDMRFVYCACVVAYMINDWSGIDEEATIKFITSSITYEGAFGQGHNLEAHGGSTYCAIASLALMGRLNDETLPKEVKDRAIRWCIWRLGEGFHGRPNKPDDTCYTFWIGGALRLLVNSGEEIEPVIQAIACKSHQFVLSTQDAIVGGMAKWPDMTSPDPLHTYLGLSGMSLFLDPKDNIYGLLPVDPALNITMRASAHLSDIKSRNFSNDKLDAR